MKLGSEPEITTKQLRHGPVACPQWSRHSSRKTLQSKEQRISTTLSALPLCGQYLQFAEPPQQLQTPVSRRRFGSAPFLQLSIGLERSCLLPEHPPAEAH